MQKTKYTFYKYRYMTFYKSIHLLSKNFVKRHVFSPFFQLAKDGNS